MKKNAFWLFLLPIVVSCSKEPVAPRLPVPTGTGETPPAPEPGTLYTIPQGQHYATSNSFKALTKTQLRFRVKFDNSAMYQSLDPQNQADINKLYGMSDCGGLHHTNSARFGWRWYQNRLELLAYSYRNGVNTSTLLSAISPNQWYTCELQLTDSAYVFLVNGQRVEHPRGCSGPGQGYQLYPYFGGDEVAPHAVTIRIEDLN